MPLTDQHRFGMQLAHMSRGWRAELDRRLAGLGLSQARWLVLLHLARFDEPPTQRELAQSVGVEGPTLARLLDSLEAQGLVERQAVVEDRRAKKLMLCPPARRWKNSTSLAPANIPASPATSETALNHPAKSAGDCP